MRENENSPNDAQYDEAFARLTEQIREHDDAGLTAFEDSVKQIQKALDEKYSELNTPFDNQEAVDIDEQLEEDWNHNGSIAHVSGRIYLHDSEIEDMVPEEWGESFIDENDDTYYLVDGIQLRSVGAEVIPSFSHEGKVLRVRVGYTFALTDDSDEMPVVCAYPGDLFEHRYDQPTPQEAITRLENEWPRQFEALVERISAVGEESLPTRLSGIIEELQEELSNSESFRMLAEAYLQAFVTFDQTLPYSLGLEKTIEYYEGENPYLDDDKGEWIKLDVEGSVALLGFRPKLNLRRLNDGSVHCLIIVSTYNNEDGDAAEYVRFDTANTISYKSTRALHSLVSRAVQVDGRVYSLAQPEEEQAEFTHDFDTRDGASIEYAEQEVERSEVPERIAVFEALDKEFKRVRQLIKRQRTIKYETREEATQASTAFIGNELNRLSDLLFQTQGVLFDASGEGVLLPNDESKLERDDEGEGRISYKHQLSDEVALVALETGDSLRGMALTMVPFVDTARDDEGDVEGFQIKPSLIVRVGRRQHVPLTVNEVPLVEITEDRRALVPLDGSADISIEPLERYRAFTAAIDALDEHTKQSMSVALVRALNTALIDEVSADRYIDFTRTELFEVAADELLFLEEEPKKFKQIVDLFEKVIVGHAVQLVGEIFVKSEDNSYVPREVNETNKVIRGTVVDIRTDIDGSDVFLAITDEGYPAVYMRLRSIQALSF